MLYDAIIVGAGMAGLTAAAYLCQAGHSVLLCERQDTVGGLVRSFERNGFVYDGGIRAMEDSGIILPMLRQLGIEIEFVPSPVAVGIEDQVIQIRSEESLVDYQQLLTHFYPESAQEIAEIVVLIRRVMDYMDVLYGIDNPALMDLAQNPGYLVKTVLPWMFKYALALPKIAKLEGSVGDYLRRYTQNQSLLDMICQHFFQETPASFALSYFSLYLDYRYPRGGTGVLPTRLAAYITEREGAIKTDCEIVAVDPAQRTVTAASGETHTYKRLIWAADLKTLYRQIDLDAIEDDALRGAVQGRRSEMEDKIGGDSVLTLFLGLDLPPSYFAQRGAAHFFYTPSRVGQSQAGPLPLEGTREEILAWLDRLLALTTYEISCPALRDANLAPAGQTGLIVSLLFDHGLTQRIADMGWYDAFKAHAERRILEVLDGSVFAGITAAVIDQFSSTPLTMERLAATSDGAITGWAFTNDRIPAETRMLQIAHSVRTPLPGIAQAGQWTYSPSGLPIAILTGKLAADATRKALG